MRGARVQIFVSGLKSHFNTNSQTIKAFCDNRSYQVITKRVVSTVYIGLPRSHQIPSSFYMKVSVEVMRLFYI